MRNEPPHNFATVMSEKGLFIRTRLWLRENRVVVHFGLVFSIVLGIMMVGLQFAVVQRAIIEPHLRHIAALCGSALNFLGTQCIVEEASILSSRFSVQIVQGCDSIYPTAMLWAAFLAYPARWFARVIGILVGAIVLFLLNLVRVITMFYLGLYAPSLFDMIHLYAWQALFILLTLGVWLFWAARFGRESASVAN